jgi:hypothetical protein
MAFNSLPKEVLHHIIYHRPLSHTAIRNYSLVCRSLRDVAGAVMYRDIDLTVDDRRDEDINEMSTQRQVQMLTSIASYILSLSIITC